MINFNEMLLCAQVNIRKGLVNPRIITIFVVTLVFLAYHSFGLSQFLREIEYGVTPWIFPHVTTPPVMQVFAFFLVLLFCDAPFKDPHTPFLIIRTGRLNWIAGQLIYVVITSIIYTFFIFIASILVMVPHVYFSMEWGILIHSLAFDSITTPNSVTIFFNPEIIQTFSPITATLLSVLCFFLVALFVGTVILCFNTLSSKMFAGILVAGCFIFISYFSVYLGFMYFGLAVYYFSPISWMSLSFLDLSYSGGYPSPIFAMIALVTSIIVLGIVSIVSFSKKDIDLQNWGY